jgi:stress-induced morphogen
MPQSAASLEALLRGSAALGAALEYLRVDVEAGCDDKYLVVAVSNRFEGVPLLERHRLVHQAIGEAAMKEIHALTLKVRRKAARPRSGASELGGRSALLCWRTATGARIAPRALARHAWTDPAPRQTLTVKQYEAKNRQV